MKTLKLQGKMLLSILSTLLLVLALIVGYVSHRAGQVVLQDAQRIAEAETRAQALVIENRVESMQVGPGPWREPWRAWTAPPREPERAPWAS